MRLAKTDIDTDIRRHLDVDASRRRRQPRAASSPRRGDCMTEELGCRITFRRENPVVPPVKLLATMGIIRPKRGAPMPLSANENLRASA
jgi:hypothetical protein